MYYKAFAIAPRIMYCKAFAIAPRIMYYKAFAIAPRIMYYTAYAIHWLAVNITCSAFKIFHTSLLFIVLDFLGWI